MTESIACPDCGHRNPPGAGSCERCNFPLAPAAPRDRDDTESTPETSDAPAAPPAEAGAAPAEAGVPPAPAPAGGGSVALPPRRQRPPRPRLMAGQSVSLWLLFGTFAAGALIYTAIKANLDRANTPVEGAQPNQQEQVDEIRAVLSRDSSNVAAHVALANLLYDTRNWSDAIVHYQAALRRDSTQVPVLVDMGVCYYNLGDTRIAERLFQQALRHDPHQPVALFNLGIVNERREDYDAALGFFHRALQSAPPEEMKPVLVSALQRVQEKTGRTPPPLPDGAQ